MPWLQGCKAVCVPEGSVPGDAVLVSEPGLHADGKARVCDEGRGT